MSIATPLTFGSTIDITQKDQIFSRFSWVDDPQFIPGPFGGIADGGGFQEGDQSAKSYQSASAWTHVFSPSLVNVARVGVNHLLTTRFGPGGHRLGIPAQYGIQGIPQTAENGGLPVHHHQWTVAAWAATLTCPRMRSATLSRSPTTLPRFTASTASRWASNSRT